MEMSTIANPQALCLVQTAVLGYDRICCSSRHYTEYSLLLVKVRSEQLSLKTSTFQHFDGVGSVKAGSFCYWKGGAKGMAPQLDDADGRIQYAVVDAFTDQPFRGNPAAVCLVSSDADPSWMQLVAAEFNVSQTAFLVHKKPEIAPAKLDYDFELRWFTPTVEVSLCGHGTLASAYFLFATGVVKSDVVRFQTKSGILTARKAGSWKSGIRNSPESFTVELDLPMLSTVGCHISEVSALPGTLATASVLSVAKTQYDDLVVELSRKDVENLQPVIHELLSFNARGLIVTAQASDSSELDFVSRFFCPKLGISEDPVCGSAHCALAPYWAKKLGKDSLCAYQVSKRGGKLGLEVDWQNKRVHLRGEAVITMTGLLELCVRMTK